MSLYDECLKAGYAWPTNYFPSLQYIEVVQKEQIPEGYEIVPVGTPIPEIGEKSGWKLLGMRDYRWFDRDDIQVSYDKVTETRALFARPIQPRSIKTTQDEEKPLLKSLTPEEEHQRQVDFFFGRRWTSGLR